MLLHTTDCVTLLAIKVTVRPSAYVENLLFAFERCVEEFQQRDGYSSQVLAAYAELLAANLLREVQATAETHADHYRGRLAMLWNEVMNNPTSCWSVEHLAAQIPISPTHLYRLVKKHYGCSPKQYVIRLRMEKAQSLLSGTGHSITEIANVVGYANEFSFSNVFFRHVGQRPGAFRRICELPY